MSVPTEEEIKQLPRWARVAFAARCARLVRLLFKPEHGDVEVVERAIVVAENAAHNAHVDAAAYHTAVVADADAYRANAYAAAAAAAVVDAVDYANAASQAARTAAKSRRHIRADFDKLLQASKAEGWTDETPVSPEFFGPAPDLLGETVDASHADDAGPPAITIVWDPELVDPADYADLVTALGNVVRAEGGRGIKLIDSNTFGVPSEEEVPV